MPCSPTSPELDAVFTIAAPLGISGISARQTRNIERTLTAKILSHSAGSSSVTLPPRSRPALL